MKILHFADSHFSGKRLDECVRNFEWMVNYAKENSIDVIVSAGDLFDVNTMINSDEYREAVRLVGELRKIAPVVIIRGNHDPSGALDVFRHLDGDNGMYVFDDVGNITIDINGEKLNILALPYMNPVLFSDSANRASDIFTDAKEYYETQISDFIKSSNELDINIIIAHLSVYGAELANNETITSNEVMLDVGLLDNNKINAVMLGHIHKRDQSIFIGKRIRYSAPHYRLTYGDKSSSVGFVVWTIKDNNTIIEEIDTPARKMVEYKLSVDETKKYISKGSIPFDVDDNTDIKVVFDIPEGMSQLLDDTKLKLRVGKSNNLRVELKTIPKNNVRSMSIVGKKKVMDKVLEWLRIVDDGSVDIDSLRTKVEYVDNRVGSII